jgi:MFS family permease
MVASMLPVIRSTLKVGIEELALILAAQVAGLAVLQIPAGVLALRFGSRSMYLVGVFLCGFSYVAAAFSRNAVGVQLGVFGGGSGEAIVVGTSFWDCVGNKYSEVEAAPDMI